MANFTIEAEPGRVNLSPVGFRLWARQYFKCYLDFQRSDEFSPVPFFLCCRAIELALKAKHLEKKSQKEVKDLYSHDLLKSYSELDAAQKTLSPQERELLTVANTIYVSKGFEYLNVLDAVTGYKRFPDLDKLGALAKKIIGFDD